MIRASVVVVGASLGGLAAVETVLRRLPARFPVPVALVQHRRADSDSRLVELLQAHSALKILEPEDKDPLLPGHFYVAPPNYHMMIDKDSIALSVDPPVSHARPSIDVLFESAAATHGASTVGVILTAASEDGARGAAAIKRAGGHLLVQDPNTAESPVAARATLARTPVDGVLRLERLADELVALCRRGL